MSSGQDAASSSDDAASETPVQNAATTVMTLLADHPALVPFTQTEEYKRFRSVSCDKVESREWKYFDIGPKESNDPVVLLPGGGGTGAVFYNQLMSLSSKGYRMIAISPAPYFRMKDFLRGFERFLKFLNIERVHLIGASLGGYLAQWFLAYRPRRVMSLMLINTFVDTELFRKQHLYPPALAWLPRFMLQKMMLESFPQESDDGFDLETGKSVDFMVEQVESLTQSELASRFLLNCNDELLPAPPIDFSSKVTILDPLDNALFPEKIHEDVLKYYPNATEALIKNGGIFAYLSAPEEVSMHIQVHLRRNGCFPVGDGPKYSAHDQLVPMATDDTAEPRGIHHDDDDEVKLDKPTTAARTAPPLVDDDDADEQYLGDD